MVERRVALVTGAARGIGRATCLRLAAKGCDIVAVDVARPIEHNPQTTASRNELDELVTVVEADHQVTCVSHEVDVRDGKGMHAVVTRTVERFGRLDVVVPQAAVAVHKPLESASDEEWDLVLGVNLLGVVRTLRPAIPVLKRQKSGRIVAVGSVGSRMGAANVAPYIASKWALVGLIKTAALELGPYGVTANIVCPTAVNTRLFRDEEQYRDIVPELYESDAIATLEDRERRVQEALKTNHALPVGWIEPEDVADAIAFLASDRARYISGEVLDVAAGWNALNSS